MSGKHKILDVMFGTRRAMWIYGLYHGNQLPKNALFEARRLATLVVAAALPISMLANVLLSEMDPEMFVKQICVSVLAAWVMLRILIYLSALSKQQALEDQLGNDIFNLQNEHQDRLISSVKDRQKYLVRGAVVANLIVGMFFTLPPIVISTNTNTEFWTPFHGKTDNVFISIYDSFNFLIVCIINLIMDCNFIGFASIVTIQVKILKDNLEHATERDSEADYEKNERRIQARLRTCIIHHNAILDLARRVDELFASALFIQIILAVMEIFFFGVQLFTETDRAQLIFWLLCFLIVTGHTLVTCWCGQTLITQSSGIIGACYMSGWYTCTSSTRKTYFIIMEQAKRPITLNGGPFFTLSYNIYVNILRSAYSYYTVFSRLYNN